MTDTPRSAYQKLDTQPEHVRFYGGREMAHRQGPTMTRRVFAQGETRSYPYRLISPRHFSHTTAEGETDA